MKTFQLTILCCLFAVYSTVLHSQTIAFSSLVHDYGTIPDNGGKVESIFEFTNTGKKPLIINQVKAACGCTTSEYTRDSVAPGKKGSIRVLFNPAGYTSKFNKTIKIQSNSIETPEIILTVRGTVKVQNQQKISEYPYVADLIRTKTLSINFNDVKYPNKYSDTIAIFNPQDTVITINFPHLGQAYRIEVYPQTTLLPNAESIIIVHFDPVKRNEWGAFYDKIYIGFEGKQANYKTKINVSGVISEDFSNLTKKQLKKAAKIVLEKNTFSFDTITQGADVQCSFNFSNKGKSELYIRKVKTTCGCTAGKLDKMVYGANENGSINVTFNSRGKQGKVSQTITIITNDPKTPKIDVTISGFVK